MSLTSVIFSASGWRSALSRRQCAQLVGALRAGDGEQRWLAPAYPVMLGSQDRWPLAELGRRPRVRQEPEQAR